MPVDAIRKRFVEALGEEHRAGFVDRVGLADELDALVTRARSESGLAVEGEAFVAFVAGHVDATTNLQTLHAGDLMLAHRSSLGDPAALRVIEDRHLPRVRSLFGRWRLPSTSEDEFLQALREHLFVGPRPRIASYAGQGRLESWLRMVASRMLTDISRRRTGPDALRHDAHDLIAALSPADDPAADFIKAQYRPEVSASIAHAVASLDAPARNLLRQRFIHGLSLEDIAALHGIHRVTVSKRLLRARKDVMGGLRADLAQRLGTTPLDVDTIIRLCASRLDVGLEAVLGSSES